MERCPKCGYKAKVNWPMVMSLIAFQALYLIWMLGDYRPREYRWIGLSALMLFWAGFIWMVFRNRKDYRNWKLKESTKSL